MYNFFVEESAQQADRFVITGDDYNHICHVLRMQAGDTLRQADRYAREVIEAAGYGPHFGHSLGHGIGLECHEAPRVSPRGEGTLQPGMVITVEPGIYLADTGGVRIENMCYVGHHSVSSLTQAENSLIII